MIKDKMLFENLRVDFIHARGGYEIQCFDLFSGKQARAYCSMSEMGAIMRLLFGSLDIKEEEALYSQVEHLFEGWPVECRPLP